MVGGIAFFLELVVSDLVRWDFQGREHPVARLNHHGRAAEIILQRLGMRMVPQILVEDDLMDESNVPLPVVFRLR
jgi:hypothetical protein